MSNTRKATGIPAEPTPVSSWKKAGDVLTLPSGNIIRVKNPGITGLAHMGLIPNSLMSVIMTSTDKGKEPDMDQVLQSADIGEMLDMMSNAIMVMAVEPEIHPVPEDENTRDPNLLYIDDIGEEDKMFIWQWATGGTTDVEQFRNESRGVLDALPGRSAVAVPAKRAAARKRPVR